MNFDSVISCVSLDKLLNVSVLLAAYFSHLKGPVSNRALTCRGSAVRQGLKARHPLYSALVFSVALPSGQQLFLFLQEHAQPQLHPQMPLHVSLMEVTAGHSHDSAVCMPCVGLRGYNTLQQLSLLPRQTSLAQALFSRVAGRQTGVPLHCMPLTLVP